MTEELRITKNNRVPLQDVIPLSTPYLVFIDPSNVCNQQCAYCPTANHELLKQVGRKPAIMNLDLFKKIIDQFQGFPEKIKTLRLYKDGEPLINPMFPEMIKYANDSNKFKTIDTTSNGTLLNERLINKLLLTGLNKIFLSVPLNYTEQYKGMIRYMFVNCRGHIEIFAKIAGDFCSPEKQKKFIEDFTPITDSCAIEHTAPCWPGYNTPDINTKVGIYGQPLQEDVLVCPYPFYTLSINANGTVSHCFVDWKNDLLLGDLNKEKIIDIWNGNRLRWIRITMALGDRYLIRNCGVCEHNIYGQPDNIDKYRDDIFHKIIK